LAKGARLHHARQTLRTLLAQELPSHLTTFLTQRHRGLLTVSQSAPYHIPARQTHEHSETPNARRETF
jgi:hypothetical protein